MENGERLTVRLSSDALVLLNELVLLGKFKSESEAVRQAVDNLLDRHFTPEQKATVLESYRSRGKSSLSDFVSEDCDVRSTLNEVILRGLEAKKEGE